MILHCEGDTQALEDDAKGILSLLWNSYPGHPWSVRCSKGIIFIRHLAFPGNWGMNLRVTEVDHDAAVMKKKIIMLAGEWLERAEMIRGRYDAEQNYKLVDGVPVNEQIKKPLDMSVEVKREDLRDEARPQVGLA